MALDPMMRQLVGQSLRNQSRPTSMPMMNQPPPMAPSTMSPDRLSPDRMAQIRTNVPTGNGVVSTPTMTTSPPPTRRGGGGGGGQMQQMGAGTALMSFLDAISAAKSGQPMQNSQYGEMRFGRRLGTDPSRGTAGGTGVFAFGVPRQGQGGKGNRPFKLGNRSG